MDIYLEKWVYKEKIMISDLIKADKEKQKGLSH
jgi:hypothetical protein